LARRIGYTDDQIENLKDFDSRDDFTDREKAALRLTDRMTIDASNVDDALWSDVRKHFDEGEVIELLAAIGLFNYFNRFNEVLRMEPSGKSSVASSR
jgi:alkylhydroperoxidase family enzyme